MRKLLVIHTAPLPLPPQVSALESKYRTEFATSTTEALDSALSLRPEIIISFTGFLEEDAIKLFRALKSNPETSSIPLLLLSSERFDPAIAKDIESILQSQNPYAANTPRESKFDNGSSNIGNFVDTLLVNPLKKQSETEFTTRLENILREQYPDSHFVTGDLAVHMGMGLRSLQRKFKYLFNSTPAKIINSFRMHQAEHLLQGTSMTISEIALSIGFSNPSSFSHSFKSHVGLAPLEYRNIGTTEPK